MSCSKPIHPATATVFVAYGRVKIDGPLGNLLKLRFGWDGLDVAVLRLETIP